MKNRVFKNDITHQGKKAPQDRKYFGLNLKFVLLTLVCSVAPLLLVGWIMNVHYTKFASARMIQSFQNEVDHHKKIIDLFLKQRSSALQLIARTHTRENLLKKFLLTEIFELLNREYWSITDLGIIDSNGDHLAYVGPYDLRDKNYKNTFWFKEVMEKGLYISDMFMGFRNEPHFIIAVSKQERDNKWILRATIDTEKFRSLVENVHIGRTGEVYLVNREGVFQTTPRFSGEIMEKSPIRMDAGHEGIKVKIFEPGENGHKKRADRAIVAQAWLDNPQWMLVVRQKYCEALNSVNHANRATLLFLYISAAMILVVSIFITRFMISIVKRRDCEADKLGQQLQQTGKLAAIGELSAGVAHEINNPLAIILTERQILMDLFEYGQVTDEDFEQQFKESMAQINVQVLRCKQITQNLLRFARRTKAVIETVDINAFIMEVVNLMEREAKTGGIKFFTDLDKSTKSVLSDPSQLQQVFLNLITNAIDAHADNSYGRISIVTKADKKNRGIWVSISDTGSGIDEKALLHVFDPFFTTKPVGQGTGLGLSICYSTMKQLGGHIDVHSQKGEGTEFTLFIPEKPPVKAEENVQDNGQ